MVRGMQNLPHSLSITRQAIQEIWHVACHTEKNKVFGLLGISSDGLICRVQHLENLTKENLKYVANQWAEGGLSVQGIFQSEAFDMKFIHEIGGIVPTQAWVYLVLNIDTQGCLKSTLYGLKNDLEENEFVERSMILVDDGQYPLKG